MRFSLIREAITSLAIIIGVNVAAVAADMPTKAPLAPAPEIPGWTFSLTPYAWALSLNGSLTVKGRSADVNVGFSTS